MSEKVNAPESENAMQDIQSMMTDLLTNAVEKMQKKSEDAASDEIDLNEIKSFVAVMQKFIDNVEFMVRQFEAASTRPGDANDKILEGYMATADNVLEIASFSMKDALTGLSNRYGFDNRIVLEWNRATRGKSTLGLMIFAPDGLDNCDDINKRDEIVKEISKKLINSGKRSTDFIVKWSDNEFAVLLPDTNTSGTNFVVERIREEIESLCTLELPKKDGRITVSMGVCVYMPEHGEQSNDFIKKAYNAYIEAKRSGGDTVVEV